MLLFAQLLLLCCECNYTPVIPFTVCPTMIILVNYFVYRQTQTQMCNLCCILAVVLVSIMLLLSTAGN